MGVGRDGDGAGWNEEDMLLPVPQRRHQLVVGAPCPLPALTLALPAPVPQAAPMGCAPASESPAGPRSRRSRGGRTSGRCRGSR